MPLRLVSVLLGPDTPVLVEGATEQGLALVVLDSILPQGLITELSPTCTLVTCGLDDAATRISRYGGVRQILGATPGEVAGLPEGAAPPLPPRPDAQLVRPLDRGRPTEAMVVAVPSRPVAGIPRLAPGGEGALLSRPGLRAGRRDTAIPPLPLPSPAIVAVTLASSLSEYTSGGRLGETLPSQRRGALGGPRPRADGA